MRVRANSIFLHLNSFVRFALLLLAVFIVKNGAEHALYDDIQMVKSYLKFLASKGYWNTFLFIYGYSGPCAIRKVKQNWKHGPFYNDNDTDNDNDDDNNNCRFN